MKTDQWTITNMPSAGLPSIASTWTAHWAPIPPNEKVMVWPSVHTRVSVVALGLSGSAEADGAARPEMPKASRRTKPRSRIVLPSPGLVESLIATTYSGRAGGVNRYQWPHPSPERATEPADLQPFLDGANETSLQPHRRDAGASRRNGLIMPEPAPPRRLLAGFSVALP